MKRVQCIGFKEEGQPYRIVNENFFLKQLNELPPGKYQHVVEKYKRKATHAQFKYLYGMVYPLSMIALNNAGYEFTDVDQVDLFWRQMFANKKIINRESGEVMDIPMSKSEFMTVDEDTYCNAIRNYVSEYLGTSIPDPDPNYQRKKNDFIPTNLSQTL